MIKLSFNEIAPIAKAVVFSLFGERFQAREELLLLRLIAVCVRFCSLLFFLCSCLVSPMDLASSVFRDALLNNFACVSHTGDDRRTHQQDVRPR